MTQPTSTPPRAPAGLSRIIQSKDPERRAPDDYRRLVKDYYDGPAGWFTVVSGFFTGHESLAGRLFVPEAFDVRGCKRILDAGCGNGRYLRFLLRGADPDAQLHGFDLSQGMLQRAYQRLRTDRPSLLVADLTRLPYRNETFDAIVSGWVLEHLQDPAVGLRELARVLVPGGKLLLLTTEHTVTGAICSRVYHCRTTRREDLRATAAACGLEWHREYWWSGLHKRLRLGGILVELRKGATGR
jgi:ubiquinone/menaquinone biosynthesis C-methylase UbiE